MKDIAIYGAGGLGREIACIIQHINLATPSWNMIGYFDDGINIGERNPYGQILGGIKEVNSYPKELSVIMGIASSSILMKIISQISNPLINFPNVIAPNVFFFDINSFQIGQGNLIAFGSRVSCSVKLGNFNLLNGCVSLGHDVQIGDFNIMQPETRISGETSVGNENFFGVRSTVLQQIKIGNNTCIGANSLIMRKTKDGMTYFGNPAKIINDK